MSVSSAQILTKQFYEWERRGRGWQFANYSCDLEPPFRPFWGHYVESSGIIDDGKVPSFWTVFTDIFARATKETVLPEEQEQTAFPYTGISNCISIYIITLPKNFKPASDRIAEFLVMLSYRKSPISFEIVACEDTIKVQFATQDSDAAYFFAQAKAFFPLCGIVATDDDYVLETLQHSQCLYTVDFGLTEEFMRPLAHGGMRSAHEPYTALFGVLERLQFEESVIIQVLFSGVHNAWGESILNATFDQNQKQSFFLDAPEMPQLAREKVSKPLFGVTIRAFAASDTMDKATVLLQHVSTAIVHASTSASNSLMPLRGEAYTINMRLADIVLRETHRVGMLLNVDELATFVHFPSVNSQKLIGGTSTTKGAPAHLAGHSYCLGSNVHQGIETTVSIATEQRLKHIHILGATGTGKSTLLQSLIIQDIVQGNGLSVLDPHGDLIDAIMLNVPQHRIKDVVLIDPSDALFPIGFNILLAHSDVEKELLASDLVAVFRRFSTSWGDQMNSVFANAILAFVYNTKTYHLGDLRRFLIEATYRNAILATVTDSDIVYYWLHEYPILRGTSIGSILTRLDSFLRPKVIRNMVCQKQSLDFADLMDTSKIVLVKLSQGLMGAENSFLLGAFLISKLQQTAMARQAQTAQTRVPFFCYIDEFQYFITPSMVSILSGARKYGLGLVLSHQDMQQLSKYDTDIASSILSNAGTRICFRLGDTDAKRLEDGFADFSSEDLQNLEVGEAIARVNTKDADFNLSVIPYRTEMNSDYTETIIKHSRKHYSIPIPEQLGTPKGSFVPSDGTPPEKPTESSPKVEESPETVSAPSIREHLYLQTFIKAMAETHGYIAQLEVQTPDGTGQVDVLLSKDGIQMAVEISITTTAEWELHNIEKCLTAGYEKIVLVSNSSAKLKQIAQLVKNNMPVNAQQKIQFVAPDEFQSVLIPNAPQKESQTIMKGYRVKVQYEEGGTSKQDLLKTIIQAGKKP